MSHKTGKRVLTASTTIALAAVGLAVSPMAAHAVAITPVQGCGTTDTFSLPVIDGVTSYSVAGGNAIPLPAYESTDGTDSVYSFGKLTGAYNTTSAVASTANPGQNYPITFWVNNAAYADTIAANVVTNLACTVGDGGDAGTAANPVPAAAAAGIAGVIKSPGSVTTGKVALYYTKGVNYVVTDGGVATTYTAASFGANPAAGALLEIATTAKGVTVQAVAVDSNYLTTPNPMAAWSVITDGTTGVTAPAAPVLAANTNTITYVESAVNYTWRLTDTSVTTQTGAVASGTALTGGTYPVTAADRGKTLRFWAIAAATKSFLPDGSTAKYYDVAVPSQTTVDIKSSEVVFTDNTGTANDTVLAPSKAGVKYYYKVGTGTIADLAAIDTNTWKPLTAGSATVVAANGSNVTVAAVQTDNTTVITKDGGGAAAVQYFQSPGVFTDKQILTPAAPTIVDGSGLADSYTFPTITTGIDYGVTFSDGTNTLTLTAAQAAAKAGQTLPRAQWTVAGTGGAATTAPDLSKDIIITTTPALATGFSTGYALPAGFVQAAKPWTQTVLGGTAIAAPAPVFTDNPGTGVVDNVTLTQTTGVSYAVAYDSNADGTYDTSVTVTYTNGAAKLDIPAGKPVQVTATAGAGYIFSNPDPSDATQKSSKFTYSFTDGAMATPAEPSKSDLAGTDDDTYTINGATGIDYYIDGVKFDAAKVNLPQSTDGKSSIVVTAKAQSGYALTAGATTTWTLEYGSSLGEVTVDNTIVSDAPPTTTVEWSADGATSYRVTFQKLLSNGQRGPELTWFEDTDATTADFVAMEGDTYYIRVVAMNDEGESDVAETMVEFPGKRGYMDIAPGDPGTFGGSWDHLTNLLAAQDLPYFDDTAALGYNNSSFTVTLPEGSRSFDLYATVHQYGSKGKITVNGVNWADFDTNSAKWGAVTDPYMYPVRSVSGWDPTSAAWKTVTIKVTVVDPDPMHYVALDAYEAR